MAKCNYFATALLSPALVLPQDLIVEILSWLPVKALMRFSCVSKTWNSLIFHPTFVKLHLQRSSKNTHVLAWWFHFHTSHFEGVGRLVLSKATPCPIRRLLEKPLVTIDDYCYVFDRRYFVIGSCNGLVCLGYLCEKDGFEKNLVRFWNPATRIMSNDSPHLRLRLSNYQTVRHAFGFDDGSHAYKVVILVKDHKSQNWEVRVHCLGDTCWRIVLTCPAFPILGLFDGQFVSGTVNWLALRSSGFDYQWKTITPDQLVIFSFDLKRETYRYLLMPNGLSEVPFQQPYLGVLKGCLCLSHDHRGTHFVVWLMREFGDEKSWTQLLNVSYDHLQMDVYLPLCMSENEDVLLLKIIRECKLVLYNRRDNKIDHVEIYSGKRWWLFSFNHVPSLVLPY